MHNTALEIGRLTIEIYADRVGARILEIGSLDVNGSLRQFAPEGSEYVGVDIVEGKGVDIVVDPRKPLPFNPQSFDLAIASSVFEHDPAFWMTFLELGRLLRDGGYLYVNTPSNGAVHRYPEDHWRLYPDSGLALERWAKSQQMELTLIESFTAPRIDDIWNDFVAVFRKGTWEGELPARSLHAEVKGTNVWTLGATQLANPKAATQDMELIDRGHKAAVVLEAQIAEAKGRIAVLESTLRQRQEEIEQTHRDMEAAKRDAQEAMVLRDKLKEADAWVFRLAGERQAAEKSAALQKRRADRAVAKAAAQEASLRRLHDEAVERRNAERQLGQMLSNFSKMELESSRTKADLQRAESSVKARFHELKILTELLESAERNCVAAASQREWLVKTYSVLANRPWWWSLMPREWGRRREHDRLKRKRLFDARRYLELYPDVASNGMDPVRHYILHGMLEGRTLAR